MWKKIKMRFNRFWEWLFWREDSDTHFNNWWDDDGIPGDSQVKGIIFMVFLFILIIPIIYFVIWLDGYLK